MVEFTSNEKRILKAMLKLKRVSTTNEIADWADLSWNTTYENLKGMRKKGYVDGVRKKNKRTYWYIKN